MLTPHCCRNTAQPKVSIQLRGSGKSASFSCQTRVTKNGLNTLYSLLCVGAKWVEFCHTGKLRERGECDAEDVMENAAFCVLAENCPL